MTSSRVDPQSWSGIPMGSTRTWKLLLLTAVLLALFTASAQQSNFGIKVKCYLMDGTVVCPGCNSRAGLLCRRNTIMESCNVKPEFPFNTKPPSVTQIYEDEQPTTIKETNDLDTKNTTQEIIPFGEEISQEEIEHWSKKARDNLQFRLFLYRILQPAGRRWKRDAQDGEILQDAQKEEDGEICTWNGDCPCPLICCKTGDGCPKRCVKGIRLPPPWG